MIHFVRYIQEYFFYCNIALYDKQIENWNSICIKYITGYIQNNLVYAELVLRF